MEIIIDPITLFRKSPSGSIHQWTISAVDDDTILIQWGTRGGSLQAQREIIGGGLAGRSLLEQVESRIRSRVNSKLDTGYVYSKSEAMSLRPTNRLGLNKPMLAARWKDMDVTDIDFVTSCMQVKYDGHRCLIHYDGDSYTAYSRNGKPITIIDEILEAVSKCGISPGTTLDGELYHHGTPLQTISSWAKRRQPNTSLLSYVMYDIMTEIPLEYFNRHDILSCLHLQSPLQLAPTDFNVAEADVPRMLSASIDAGYEGLILRRNGFVYEDGKRSKGLVKIKKFLDAEYEVLDIIPSSEGYGILVMETSEAKTFRATAPGSHSVKRDTFLHKQDFIGRHITIQYANLTKDGVPFHPIATMWREMSEE